MNKTKNTKIFIIAGEASGDNLGAKLIKSLHQLQPSIEFYGIGGQKMQDQGFKSLFPIKELSIMGFVEIIPYIPKFFLRLRQSLNYIKQVQPDIVITIDSPGFNFRLAKKVKALGIKLVHYVAPTVWAYKPERAKKIAKIYDHLLVLLPWEAEYFIREGLETSFIGHPVIEDLSSYTETSNFRVHYNIQDNEKIISLFPGSRNNEINILLPIFKQAVEVINNKTEKLVLIISTLPHLIDKINNIMSDYKGRIIIVREEDEKKAALANSDAAIVKSGTVSFEVAMAKVPMIIAYKINNISAFIIKRLIKVKYVNLINLINDQEVIPEFLQEKCTAENIATAVKEILKNPSIREEQVRATNKALVALGLNDEIKPSDQAAQIILNLIKNTAF